MKKISLLFMALVLSITSCKKVTKDIAITDTETETVTNEVATKEIGFSGSMAL